MGEIVDFLQKSNMMDMDPVFKTDAYLRLAALNGLEKAGYTLDRSGLLQFQHNIKHPETGTLSMDDFTFLIYVHEPDQRQEILNYLEKNYGQGGFNKMGNDRNKKPNYVTLTIFLFLLFFFEAYGIISCFFDIVRWIN